MEKKYDLKKLGKLKSKMEKENIKKIQGFPFPYVTGREEEERERDCVLEYDNILETFVLIDIETNEILQDDKDLLIDDGLIDDLLTSLKLKVLEKRIEEIPCENLNYDEILQDTILVEFNAKVENDTIILFSRTAVRNEDEDGFFQFDEFVHQTEIALDAIEISLRYLTNAGFSLTQVEYILLSLSQYQGLPIKVVFGNNLLTTVG